MRLVRFLAAGKSLMGSKDLTGRYRLPEGRALPKFNSNRPTPPQQGGEAVALSGAAEPTQIENAESVTSKPEKSAAPVCQGPESNVATTQGEEIRPVVIAANDEAVRPAVGGPAKPVLEPSSSTPYPRLADSAPPRRSVLRKLFGWLPGLRERAARGPIPVFSKVPVQTELSLENVKVVRNDLTESDLEVKPVNPAKTRAAASAPLAGELESREVAMRATPTGGVNNGPD
jgi:hypothetical protein